MQALVLEKKGLLAIRDVAIDEPMGPRDVRIAINTVGICGSDVHYYKHGRIGDFIVDQPMVLGHEVSGMVVEVGDEVSSLRVGDRVCMEPGVPDPHSRHSRLGIYNLDPAVRFWATPPVHGVLRPTVVHPEALTFKLPDTVSFAEGAMVEPLAVGVHAVMKAGVKPGDTAVVLGAGTIGLLTAQAALAAGCSRIILSDVSDMKLSVGRRLGPITGVNVREQGLAEVVHEETDGWGADVVFEASGSASAAESAIDLVAPSGAVVFVGMPSEPIRFDVVKAQIREARIEHVFRYAHVFPRVLALLGSGHIDVSPLLSRTFPFNDSVAAFELAATGPEEAVKIQISLG